MKMKTGGRWSSGEKLSESLSPFSATIRKKLGARTCFGVNLTWQQGKGDKVKSGCAAGEKRGEDRVVPMLST